MTNTPIRPAAHGAVAHEALQISLEVCEALTSLAIHKSAAETRIRSALNYLLQLQRIRARECAIQVWSLHFRSKTALTAINQRRSGHLEECDNTVDSALALDEG